MKSTAVEVRNLSKNYGQVQALQPLDLSIDGGEYFVLLGPSGGGKTTLLRLIGGFITPNTGTITLDGHDVSGLPPNRRPTGMVFQSYALFPHMTVADNVGYGLKIRKVDLELRNAQVAAALEQVSLQNYRDRKPRELSGGQQQRVQLARALVLQPRILLLDEPLAALDAQLRKDMCYELKALQAQVGITFVHVTHNQEEAMTVADRIALIASGQLIEQGSTREIYQRPKRRFTAEFIGENSVFSGRIKRLGDGHQTASVDIGCGEIQLGSLGPECAVDQEVSVSVRSEQLQLSVAAPLDGSMNAIPVSYVEEVYLGLVENHVVRLPDDQTVTVRALAEDRAEPASVPGSVSVQTYQRDDRLWLSWRPDQGRLHTD